MNDLIRVSTSESNEPIVSGRDLYEFLEVESKYLDWFRRMCEYGFTKNIDFVVINEPSLKKEGSRTVKRDIINHAIKLDMAKEIAMVQRNEKGKQARLYFIEVEKRFRERHLQQLPQTYLEALKALVASEEEKQQLITEGKQKDQIIGELKPKSDYTDMVLRSKDTVNITQIAKDYGMTAQEMNAMLKELKIQFKENGQWLLYKSYHDKGYTKSVTHTFTKSDGSIGTNMSTKWTQKGRLFLYGQLKSVDILPTMEQ